MDADEVIAGRDLETLQKLVQNAAPPYPAFSFVTRNYTNRCETVGWKGNDGAYPKEEASLGWIPSIKVRLFRNDPEIRFEYPVHELVEPALSRKGVSIRKTTIPIHHYGAADRFKRKGEHYFEIGLSKLEKMGESEPALRELAVNAGLQGRYDMAIDLWKRYQALQGESYRAHINLSSCYAKKRRYDLSLAHAKSALSLQKSGMEGHLNAALSHLHLGRHRQAFRHLETLCAANPNYYPGLFLTAAIHCCDEAFEVADRYFERLGRSPYAPYLAGATEALTASLTAAGQSAFAEKIRMRWEQWEDEASKRISGQTFLPDSTGSHPGIAVS
jgi:tetratricopeptide (TPR) repeat protein